PQFAFVEPVAGIPFLGAGDAVGFATQRARFALAELSAVAPAVDRLARFVQFAANPGRADDGLDLADSGSARARGWALAGEGGLGGGGQGEGQEGHGKRSHHVLPENASARSSLRRAELPLNSRRQHQLRSAATSASLLPPSGSSNTKEYSSVLGTWVPKLTNLCRITERPPAVSLTNPKPVGLRQPRVRGCVPEAPSASAMGCHSRLSLPGPEMWISETRPARPVIRSS